MGKIEVERYLEINEYSQTTSNNNIPPTYMNLP